MKLRGKVGNVVGEIGSFYTEKERSGGGGK